MELCQLKRYIHKGNLEWAVEVEIWLSAFHVPGVKNAIADLQSKVFYDNKEWPSHQKSGGSGFQMFKKTWHRSFCKLTEYKKEKFCIGPITKLVTFLSKMKFR